MSQGLIEFSLEELKQATNSFGESKLIGYGSFGPVYNGLVRDTIVAIKRFSGSIHPRFLEEVTNMSNIRHHNVVNVLGYCSGQQIIVYDYLVNGNMRDRLHDSLDLNFKKRISIALGAAKGLQYLHNLTPPLSHNRFKTTKVLLDADFNTKISHPGLNRLVGLKLQENDIYSFGLFLIELLTGEEPKALLTSNDELIQWISPRICSNTFVDERTKGTFTRESLRSFMKIMLKCLKFPTINRPKIDEVVVELENIYNRDLMSDECSTKITLGSELFTLNA
ncbi:unnamed protein product [Cochlearia groenlandica]